MFDNSENRIGAFAGAVALILVLALTVMAFTALEPSRQNHRESRDWAVSMPEPETAVTPTF